jgi:hypothetical protein
MQIFLEVNRVVRIVATVLEEVKHQSMKTCGGIEVYRHNDHHLHTSILKMEAAYTSETSATSLTSARCNNPRSLTSISNNHESLKSIIVLSLIQPNSGKRSPWTQDSDPQNVFFG